MTHSDLASLSAAYERDPSDKEILGRYNEAMCRIYGHISGSWISVNKISEEGNIGSFCGYGGCEVCPRCNQVTCKHRHLWEERPLGKSTRWVNGKPEGARIPEDFDD